MKCLREGERRWVECVREGVSKMCVCVGGGGGGVESQRRCKFKFEFCTER